MVAQRCSASTVWRGHPPDLLRALPVRRGTSSTALPNLFLILTLSASGQTAALCFLLDLQLEGAVASDGQPQAFKNGFPLPGSAQRELLEVHGAPGAWLPLHVSSLRPSSPPALLGLLEPSAGLPRAPRVTAPAVLPRACSAVPLGLSKGLRSGAVPPLPAPRARPALALTPQSPS